MEYSNGYIFPREADEAANNDHVSNDQAAHASARSEQSGNPAEDPVLSLAIKASYFVNCSDPLIAFRISDLLAEMFVAVGRLRTA